MAKKRTRKKQTAVQREYTKHRRRIKQFLARAEKRGYYFPENILPAKPKRITKASVSRLAKLTPEALYKKAEYVSRETGEIIEATEARKLERQKAQEKAKQTKARKKQQRQAQQAKQKRKQQQQALSKPQQIPQPKKILTSSGFFSKMVIGNFRATLAKSSSAPAAFILMSWLNKLIEENGEDAIAKMISDATEAGVEITHDVLYNTSAADEYMSSAMYYLADQGEMYTENTLEWLQQWSALEEGVYQASNFETYDE